MRPTHTGDAHATYWHVEFRIEITDLGLPAEGCGIRWQQYMRSAAEAFLHEA
jgi:hypothetical protein